MVKRFLAAVIYPRYGGLYTWLAILLEILLAVRTVTLASYLARVTGPGQLIYLNLSKKELVLLAALFN